MASSFGRDTWFGASEDHPGRSQRQAVESAMAFDAIVIGGGLLGSATAYHLVAAGARTLLIDRGDSGRATDAGAGILSPETNSREPEARGLVMRVGSVERLALDGARAGGVVIDGETVPAGAVAIAGGAWTEAFGQQLGVTIKVAPQRGQIIHLGLRGADTSRWPMIS